MIRLRHPGSGLRLRTCAAVGVGLLLCVLLMWTLRHRRLPLTTDELIAVEAGTWLCFAAGAWLVWRLPVRRAVVLIVGGGVGLQLAGLSAPPKASTDAYRYVWDGRVQAAGIDPYRYPPSARALVGLRDHFLWPVGRSVGTAAIRAAQRSTGTSVYCVRAGMTAWGHNGAPLTPGCTLINRPTVATIYPPVAEAYFAVVHFLSAGYAGIKPIQIGAAVLAVATTVLLLFALRNRDPRLAVLWAWCPLVGLEAGNNAHVDVLAAPLTVAALVTLASATRGSGVVRGGILLGLAIATKMYPALAGVGSMRRRPVALVAATVGTVVLVYVPHAIAVGGGVVGYLPGYLKEEGFDSGARFALVNPLVGGQRFAAVAAVVILLAVALVLAWRSDPSRPWRSAMVMAGMYLLVTTPYYSWYATLLVVLVALDGRVEWLAVAMAAYVGLALNSVGIGVGDFTAYWCGYGGAAIVVFVVSFMRWRIARRTAPAIPPGLDVPLPEPEGGGGGSPTSGGAGNAGAARGRKSEGGGGGSPALRGRKSISVVDVILPCLDEEGALPYVLARMPAGYRPIVVDNGSTDGSAALAARLGATVVSEPKRGFGAACHAGLMAASADVVCFCDCDGSLDPADLPLVAGPVQGREVDMVLAGRRPTSAGAWPAHARLANRLLARRIGRVTGVRLRDVGPMRAARRADLIDLDIGDRRFGYPLEMVLSAAKANWRIQEIEVGYAPRTGQSKVTGTVSGTVKAVRDMRRVWAEATAQ